VRRCFESRNRSRPARPHYLRNHPSRSLSRDLAAERAAPYTFHIKDNTAFDDAFKTETAIQREREVSEEFDEEGWSDLAELAAPVRIRSS
jgi:hypothetical protein